MDSLRFRNFLCLTIEAIVLTTMVSACSTIGQTPAPTPSVSAESTMNHSGMNHSGMDHRKMNHTMDLGPADENYDLRFIDAMIPHHEGAVVMAKDVLQKSKRPELRKLAAAIITAQTQEIAQMKQWRKDWYPKAPKDPMAWSAEMNRMMGMKPEQMSVMKMEMNLGASDAGYDVRFMKAMIPHHKAAVEMAKDLAQKTKRPELKKMAKEIILSQQAEIDQMAKLQKTP